jgi:prolyl-tRNA synthetase
MMRDTKALQAGTSHMLGQNFARAADIGFLDRDNVRKHPWGTSWGFSTRMVGATIMAHGDDSGLVLPPNVAPKQLVIVPIFRTEEDRVAVAGTIESLERSLADVTTVSGLLRWITDRREESPGFKYNHWELRGVPLRLEVGPRDVAAGQGVLVRRIDRAKETLPLQAIPAELPGRLAAYQSDVFQRALDFRAANTHHVETWDDFVSVIAEQGGFVWAHWCGSAACEERVGSESGASIRNIPFESPDEAGRCVVDGRPSERRVVFAKAY